MPLRQIPNVLKGAVHNLRHCLKLCGSINLILNKIHNQPTQKYTLIFCKMCLKFIDIFHLLYCINYQVVNISRNVRKKMKTVYRNEQLKSDTQKTLKNRVKLLSNTNLCR